MPSEASEPTFTVGLTQKQLNLIKVLIENATWRGETIAEGYQLLQAVNSAKP